MSQTDMQGYFNEVKAAFEKGNATEHTYRSMLKSLIEALGDDVTATNEPKRVRCGAPDYVVERDNLTIGYIEAKDIDVALDKIEKDEQLARYRRALDNLILTDYLEFRWYVHGEKRLSARLAHSKGKKLVFDLDGAQQVEGLVHAYLAYTVEEIRKPQDLANRMARLAHMIRDVIIQTFEKQEASDNLKDLYSAFQEVLLPELKTQEFADMFAQTLAYGLFAARYNHTQKALFRRDDASKEIPRTNPFLRKLFGTIAGPDLDDEPFVGFVDDLAQVLAFTAMDAVLADFGKSTHQEDPIVHFYETFLAQYDPKLRELRGVYYTPEPVVSYIVRSVDHLLREHFACSDGLADTSTISHSFIDEDGNEQLKEMPRVLILDPATGTGTFLYSIVEHIRENFRQMGNAGMWSSYVRQHLLPRLFGFELLMAPYAMAHLKLGMQLSAIDLPESERKTWTYNFHTDERLGIYLTNTLDEALKRSSVMFGRYISDEANEAAKVKQNDPVMVVLGNPPYSGHSVNKGVWISELLHGIDSQTGRATSNYFMVDGHPLNERNPKWLNDDYVKFIRFAQWRIERTGYGILAFITNHGYLDNPTFRGMRQSLMQSFDEIYVLDLHGNSKKREHAPDGMKDENVFDIQQGVAIGIFVKKHKKEPQTALATVHHADLWGPREVREKASQNSTLLGGKYHWLAQNAVNTTQWEQVDPHFPFYLFTSQDRATSAEYEKYSKITAIFPINSVGIVTARDSLSIHWSADDIWQTVNAFAAMPTEEARTHYHLGSDAKDWHVESAQKDIKSSGPSKSKIVPILYRPFDERFTYYTGKASGFHCRPRAEVMQHMRSADNLAVVTTRSVEIGRGWEHVFCARDMIQHHSVSLKEVNYLFPLYLYPQTQRNILFEEFEVYNTQNGRRPNIAPEFLRNFAQGLHLDFVQDGKGDLQITFGPEDFFDYMYAIFYSPTYRERYAEFLKSDFPRLPLTQNIILFRQLCAYGDRLVQLHIMQKNGTITTTYPVSGTNIVEKIEYTLPAEPSMQGRIWINKTQYFENVPSAVWNFHIGGYQVCQKWLKDRKGRELDFNAIKQYQQIIAALSATIALMAQIDESIDEQGSWPIQ